MPPFRHGLLALLLSLSAVAQEPPAAPEKKEPEKSEKPEKPEKPESPPKVEKLDENRFRVGGITFDKKTREIRFPATVNMTDGLLEFAIVHANGKIHESLLTTTVSPLHLNVAFKLLRYPQSKELLLPADAQEGDEVKFPEVPADVKAGARVNLKVEWKEGERVRSAFLNEWISHTTTEKAMAAGPWVYSGSEVAGGRFLAESSGNVAAIFITNDSLLNYPGEDDRNDEVWRPFTKRVPPIGTAVTVVIVPTAPAPANPVPNP